MATTCRFAAPLGLTPLHRRHPAAAAVLVKCGSKVPRNVALKAANGTSGGEGPAEAPEIVKAAQDAWAKVGDKYALATNGVTGLVALWTAVGALKAIDKLPILPGVFELVGIGYTGWFTYRNLVFQPDRRIMKAGEEIFVTTKLEEAFCHPADKDIKRNMNYLQQFGALPCCTMAWLSFAQSAQSSEGAKLNMVYEVGELFELGIQLSYLLILLGLLGAGTFFVIRQVLVRRELDLSAKDLQEQVRSGDGSATEYFELGAVMLRRKFYPAAIKYLQQAIQKWDRDEQDLAQVYNALGVSYKRENKLDKAIQQFEKAVELQPGYVTAWNNLGDAYEQQKDLKSALRAFEEVLLFDPNNKVARPRRDDLKQRVGMYKGMPVKSEKR